MRAMSKSVRVCETPRRAGYESATSRHPYDCGLAPQVLIDPLAAIAVHCAMAETE
jgi:hypothetical protein